MSLNKETIPLLFLSLSLNVYFLKQKVIIKTMIVRLVHFNIALI